MGALFTIPLYCLNDINILIQNNQAEFLISYRDNN